MHADSCNIINAVGDNNHMKVKVYMLKIKNLKTELPSTEFSWKLSKKLTTAPVPTTINFGPQPGLYINTLIILEEQSRRCFSNNIY